LSILGGAKRVVVGKDTTTFIGGKGKKANIEARVESLESQKENTTSKFDKEQIESRIAKMSGGVAVIRVGAATETEMKYLKDKIDDAAKAPKASIEEGIVPGGGTALAKVSKKLALQQSSGQATKGMSEDEATGYDIVVRSLEVPLRQIAMNAGKDNAA